MNLFITQPGRIRREDNTLRLELVDLPEDLPPGDEDDPLIEDRAVTKKLALPVETIDAIWLFHESTLNTRLLTFLSQKDIPLHVFNYYGHHVGTYLPHAHQLSGELVIRQGASYQDKDRRMAICRKLLGATFRNLLSNLNYYRRRGADVDEAVREIEALRDQLPTAGSSEELMGLEGMARRTYYRGWSEWLPEVGNKFTRKYHPPDNPINALISFLNSLLYTEMVSQMHRTALYPGISYLHAPQSKRFSLALDLVEPFKPVLVDRLLFRLWDKKEISAKDFHAHSNGVLLIDAARKKIVQEWDHLMKTTVLYPRLNRHVSYRQMLRLDCYKLVKHLLEDAPYEPHRINY